MNQMQVRARTLQPGGTLVHDVFAPEDSRWRAAAELWLCPLAGGYYFSDMGNEDDWIGFCADVGRDKERDNFSVIESALLFYAETPTDNGRIPESPNPVLVEDSGAKAREALEALDRLTAEWAERNAEMLAELRDASSERAICRAAAEISGLTPEFAEAGAGAVEDEFSVTTGGPILWALRRFAELAKEE